MKKLYLRVYYKRGAFGIKRTRGIYIPAFININSELYNRLKIKRIS